jgi:hypothetical protein
MKIELDSITSPKEIDTTCSLGILCTMAYERYTVYKVLWLR